MALHLWPFLFLLGSCGTIQKWVLRSNSSMFKESGDRMTREKNWEFFRDAAPGNIKFVEMLYLQDPKNITLLGSLVKSYSGYAFAVHETLALGDQLRDVESSQHKQQALRHFTTALDYGLEYLDQQGVGRSEILGLNEGELSNTLDKELGKKDYPAVLYTAQAWGSLIQMQQNNVALVSQVPKVKVLFDWVCGKDPNIDFGICDIFYAQYEASRPRMLGGDPVKAEQLYRAAMQKHPHNLLIRVGYLQHLVLPAMDEAKYEAEASVLREEFSKWSELGRDGLVDESEYRDHADINLYNAIAEKRFRMMEKNKSKIF
jgi:hypothetical protein